MEFIDPASPYIVAVLIAIMVGVYPFALWRKMSFTAATIIANAIIFIIYIAPRSVDIYYDVVINLGFNNTSLETGDGLWGLYTHMYIHADFLHVFFNMFILFLMGMPFEQRVGWKWMAVVYWGTGILGGGVINGFVTLPEEIVGIGASAAISGIIGAFAMMYPRDRIPMVIIFIILPRVQVAFGALVFILFQTFLAIVSSQLPYGLGNVGYTAHLAGVMVGVGIGLVLARKGIEAPTPGAALGRKLDKVDFERMRPLIRRPENEDRLDAVIAEDIPEVKDVLVQDLVARIRCPDCDSIVMLHKGHTLKCERCDWQLDMRKGRGE
ncbi:MAG: rhomboid family intramembrane serine protease [Thermoplasmata archaeon]|nr:MAG: rhomboid family intramembrane serine protease [Thermoplasmata archaeon]